MNVSHDFVFRRSAGETVEMMAGVRSKAPSNARCRSMRFASRASRGVGVLDAVLWSFAAGITQPIFFGGELKAAQDIRTAEQKAAAASYTGTALRAFEDVEDALAGDYYLRKRESALSEAVFRAAPTP
jgi:outer membrane protein TolC